jgi:hypothetical protein
MPFALLFSVNPGVCSPAVPEPIARTAPPVVVAAGVLPRRRLAVARAATPRRVSRASVRYQGLYAQGVLEQVLSGEGHESCGSVICAATVVIVYSNGSADMNLSKVLNTAITSPSGPASSATNIDAHARQDGHVSAQEDKKPETRRASERRSAELDSARLGATARGHRKRMLTKRRLQRHFPRPATCGRPPPKFAPSITTNLSP